MSEAKAANRRTVSPIWLYAIFGVALLMLIGWSSLRVLTESPERQVGVDLGAKGWVTLTMRTDPAPPQPGMAQVSVKSENSRGLSIELGPTVPYSFGEKNSVKALGSGQLRLSDSAYQAAVPFPAPGDYWLRLDLGSGKEARFQLSVRPAQ